MALSYIFTNYKDTYTVKNNGSVAFSYTLNKVVCGSNVPVSIFTSAIPQGETREFKVIKDGEYYLTVTDGTTTLTSDHFKIYTNLISSFIPLMESIFCGCTPCKECEECNDCEDYLKVFMQAQAFYLLNYPKYLDLWTTFSLVNTCLFTEEVQCFLLSQKVYGSAITKDTVLQLVSYYYLAFYYKDLNLAFDEEERVYVSEKYKIDKIKLCMKKRGIITDYFYNRS